MNASPSPKRIKLESPSQGDRQSKNTDDLDQEHCTICLQSFLDRTIIPVCAHEFCFECILLWSEQSRKCPLCSRSFDDSYLIHRVRSQYDYQKHYLLPLRSSPPPLTGESRANALRNTRRERQWGRRQRQQREEADQLERAIARRRWIYQHHLYAKHVASNPYTRYRPFPTPAQFTASPDLISRMTTFLRRELRVWTNLDVEFLTTYTISLMKSIDIRSESAVKLLSEFLDLDTPYTAGARHVNAEHFAHEIYSYLRSPYRDLNTYDQTAQYDTPPEISPPQEIERDSRWSMDSSRRSRSPSNSRHQSPVPSHENNAMRSRRDNSAEARREEGPNNRHGPTRSPPGREDKDFRNRPSDRRYGPSNSAQDTLCDGHLGGSSSSEPLNSAVPTENQDNDNSSVRPHPRHDDKGQAIEAAEDMAVATNTPKMSAPQGDDSAAALTTQKPGLTCFIEAGGEVADYVDNVRGGSSANAQPSRKRSAGLNVHARPRNRTLSESIQAYLARPTASGHPRKRPVTSVDKEPTRTSDMRPRLSDGPTGPVIGKLPSLRKTTVERIADGWSTPDDDAASEQPLHGCHFQSCALSSNRPSFPGYAETGVSRSNRTKGASFSSASPSSRGHTDMDTSPAAPVGSSVFHVGERTGCAGGSAVAGDDTSPSGDATLAPRPGSGSGCGCESRPTSRSAAGSGPIPAFAPESTNVDASALETRLRVQARVRVRLAALKGTMGGGDAESEAALGTRQG